MTDSDQTVNYPRKFTCRVCGHETSDPNWCDWCSSRRFVNAGLTLVFISPCIGAVSCIGTGILSAFSPPLVVLVGAGWLLGFMWCLIKGINMMGQAKYEKRKAASKLNIAPPKPEKEDDPGT